MIIKKFWSCGKLPKKAHIVKRVMMSDEDFKDLLGKLEKPDYVKIYNRCYTRLRKRGVKTNQIKSFMVDEIRSELFKLLPKKEIKITTDAEIQERKESQQPIRKKYVKMHGVRLWSDEPSTDDKIEDLNKLYNEAVENSFNENFCALCHCEKSVCRCHLVED